MAYGSSKVGFQADAFFFFYQIHSRWWQKKSSNKLGSNFWRTFLLFFSKKEEIQSAHSFQKQNFCDSCSAFVTQPFVASDSKAWKSFKEQMLDTRCSIATVIVSTQLLPSWHKSPFPVNLRSKQQTKVKEKQEHLSWLTTAIRHRHAL